MHISCPGRLYCGINTTMKGGNGMQVVVIKSPKCLRGILRKLFGIRKA